LSLWRLLWSHNKVCIGTGDFVIIMLQVCAAAVADAAGGLTSLMTAASLF
jgi:hypothetical protein